MLKMIGETLSDNEIRAIVKQADQDKDGFINFSEFSNIMNNIIK